MKMITSLFSKTSKLIYKNRKELLIKLFVYGTLSSLYYTFNVVMFQGSFLLSEFIIAILVLSLVVGILYALWFGIDKSLFFIQQSRLRKITSLIVKVTLIALILWPSMITIFQIHRIKVGNTTTPNINTAYDDIIFQTSDDITIKGWYMKHYKSKETIVFAHGLGVNRSNFLEYAKTYQTLGYNVLMFDFRGHGDSQGHTVSFGHHETKDILAAVSYLKKHYPDDTQKIYGVGFSMGGASMIYAQSDYQLFDKIIIDSSFAYSENMIDHIYRQIPTFYRNYLKTFSDKLSIISIGIPISEVKPGEKIKNVDIPTLLMHGKKDKMIPYIESEIIYNNKQKFSNAQIVLFEKSGHVTGLVDEYDKYTNAVKEFLTK